MDKLNIEKPKVGFPHTERKGFFGCETPIGWEDRGVCATDNVARMKKDKRLNLNLVAGCPRCWNSPLHIGRENQKAFLYCPYCLEKVNKPHY